MAKQVLDLYELFNLVVARGGLVEVINKKQWQEIIKGLGLPSSITSAAFTLRTQYTKYLYPLECKTVNLSNPSDLQSAIEGNKKGGEDQLLWTVWWNGSSSLPGLSPSLDTKPVLPITLAELSTATVIRSDAPLLNDEHPTEAAPHEWQSAVPAPRYQQRYRG